jgi:hypothetical protein
MARVVVVIRHRAVACSSRPQAGQEDVFYRPEKNETALVDKFERFFSRMQALSGLRMEGAGAVISQPFLWDNAHRGYASNI